jgi:hypothetical protein
VLPNSSIPLNKLVSRATDGAHAMLGRNTGLAVLLKIGPTIPEMLVMCFIHLVILRFSSGHLFQVKMTLNWI